MNIPATGRGRDQERRPGDFRVDRPFVGDLKAAAGGDRAGGEAEAAVV